MKIVTVKRRLISRITKFRHKYSKTLLVFSNNFQLLNMENPVRGTAVLAPIVYVFLFTSVSFSSAQNNSPNSRQSPSSHQQPQSPQPQQQTRPNGRQESNPVFGQQYQQQQRQFQQSNGGGQFAPNCFCQNQGENQMSGLPFGNGQESNFGGGSSPFGSSPSAANPLPQSGIPPTLIYCDNYGQQHQDLCRLANSLAMDQGMGLRPCMTNAGEPNEGRRGGSTGRSNEDGRGEVSGDPNNLSRPGNGNQEVPEQQGTERRIGKLTAFQRKVKRQAGSGNPFGSRQSYCLSNGSTITSDPTTLQQAMMYNTGLGIRCQGTCPCRIQCPQTSMESRFPSAGGLGNQFGRTGSSGFGAEPNYGSSSSYGQESGNMQQFGGQNTAGSWSPQQPYSNSNTMQFPGPNSQNQQYSNQQNFRPQNPANRPPDFGVLYGENQGGQNQNSGFNGQRPSSPLLPCPNSGQYNGQQQPGNPNSNTEGMRNNFGQQTNEFSQVPYGSYGNAEYQPTNQENQNQGADNSQNFEQENQNFNRESANGETQNRETTRSGNRQQQQSAQSPNRNRGTTRTTPRPHAGR